MSDQPRFPAICHHADGTEHTLEPDAAGFVRSCAQDHSGPGHHGHAHDDARVPTPDEVRDLVQGVADETLRRFGPPTGAPMSMRSTGFMQRIEGDQLVALDERLDRAVDAAVRTGSHLWTASMTWRVDPQLVLRGGEPIFDAETLLCSPQIGCFVCEQPFNPRLLHRRCTGEPR